MDESIEGVAAMVKIIVAFATDEKCRQYAAALEEAGISVFRKCRSASEAKRAIHQCGDGILVSYCRLPDGAIDALAWDLGKQALILAIGHPAQLELCEHPDLFRLPAPCSKAELVSAVNMLIQMHRMRLPRRTDQEKRIIQQAKDFLMRQYSMSEPEAHHHLQKCAMDAGMKLADCAARLMEMQ